MTGRTTREAKTALRDISEMARRLAELNDMTVAKLREKYNEVFGEPTRSRNKDYLRKQIAWRIQELEEGGLSDRALARIEELAKVAPARRRRSRGAAVLFPFAGDRVKEIDPRLPPVGSVITRTYQDAEYQVTVRVDGFEYAGRIYPSLSAAARAITGNHWNGFLFFGLQKRNSKAKAETE